MSRALTRWLSASPTWIFASVASLAAFSAYFSMYAFRKPFTAATFGHVDGWHFVLDFKIAAVILQVLGYATSKLIGIKVISEMRPAYRAIAILGLIGSSWVALIAFALLPAPWNVFAMFLNGLPLGMIWGLVFAYLEGRRTSEVLGAVVCASFIVSSGAVKSVGILLMTVVHVSPFWMPAATGALFIPLLLISVWMLSCLPPPSPEDEAARVKRAPMSAAERSRFIGDYRLGILLLVLTYVLATALRDFRDNFAPELWTALGYQNAASVFTAAELPVAMVALVAMAVIIVIKSNQRALAVIHWLILGGFALLGGATVAFDYGMLGALPWMILSGAGLYMVYTPFNAMLFDRLVAVSGRIANAGFLIYVADSAGYAGSCVLLLWRNLALMKLEWLQVFRLAVYATSSIGAVLVVLSLVYFSRRASTAR